MKQATLFDEPNYGWEKEWIGMPHFFIPTRNTAVRNSIDITDIKELANKKTVLFPKYPIYIISKGRWSNPLTANALDAMGINYKVVVEPLEYDNYCKSISKDKLLVLPFNNLGQGSIPARNWVWEHSIKQGFKRHWILDDNLRHFFYLNNNKEYKVKEDRKSHV